MRPVALGLVREVNPVPDADAVVDRQLREQTLQDVLNHPPVDSRPRAWRAASRRWPVIVAVVVALLALAAVALAAAGLLSGSPYRPPSYVRVNRNPRLGLGVTLSGSAKLLSLNVPDPDGGPPWAMRTMNTTRGLGCVQVGRLVNGQLGVLGQDGVAADDGRFHALPAELVQPWNCVTLDAHSKTFINILESDYASGPVLERSCESSARRDSTRPLCPARDQRVLAYGLLGPNAVSLTYISSGHRTTTQTVGRQGAYLILVSAGKPTRTAGFVGTGGSGGYGSVYFPGLLAVSYKDGRTCRPPGPAEPCGPGGYAPPTTPATNLSHVRLHTSIRRYQRARKSYANLQVTFSAPAAVTNANSSYALVIKFPPPCNGFGGTGLARDVIRGEPITLETGLPGNCPGVAIAHVALTGPRGSNSILGPPSGPPLPLSGASLLPGPETGSIGTFRFTLPRTTGESVIGGAAPTDQLPAWAR
jgi:hypothetical protein